MPLDPFEASEFFRYVALIVIDVPYTHSINRFMFEEVFMGRYSHSKGQRMSTPVLIYASFLRSCVQVIALNGQELLVAVSTLFLEDSPRRNSVKLRIQPDKQENTRNTNNAFEILVYTFIPHNVFI